MEEFVISQHANERFRDPCRFNPRKRHLVNRLSLTRKVWKEGEVLIPIKKDRYKFKRHYRLHVSRSGKKRVFIYHIHSISGEKLDQKQLVTVIPYKEKKWRHYSLNERS